MAIALTVLDHGTDTTDGTTFTTASISPAADSLLLVFVSSSISTGVAPAITPSGLGLTYSTEADQGFGSGTSDVRRMHLFSAQCGAAPGSGPITFTTDSLSEVCGYVVIQVTGHNAAAPIAQVVSGRDDTTSNNLGALILAAPVDATSRPVAWWAIRDNVNATPAAGWTELSDDIASSPAMGYEAQWRSDTFDTAAGVTFDLPQRWGGIAVEVAADTGAAPTPATGAAAGAVAWTGTGAGTSPAVPVAAGTAAGAASWTASASGSAPTVGGSNGTADGSVAWAGSGTGTAPVVPNATGTAAGSVTWTGTAIGRPTDHTRRDLKIIAVGAPASPVATTGPQRPTWLLAPPASTRTTAEPATPLTTTEPKV